MQLFNCTVRYQSMTSLADRPEADKCALQIPYSENELATAPASATDNY